MRDARPLKMIDLPPIPKVTHTFPKILFCLEHMQQASPRTCSVDVPVHLEVLEVVEDGGQVGVVVGALGLVGADELARVIATELFAHPLARTARLLQLVDLKYQIVR